MEQFENHMHKANKGSKKQLLEEQIEFQYKEFWALVKTFQGKNHKSKMAPIKDNDGGLLYEDRDKANTLNMYFATVGQNMADAYQSVIDNSLTYRVTPTCSQIIVDTKDLNTQFSKLSKPVKSSGLDGVSAKDLSSGNLQ